MFGKWFKKKPAEPLINFSAIGTDIHSHLIPGIDDGAPDMETAVQLVVRMQQLGYLKLITTPHIMADYFRNTPSNIQAGLKALQVELNSRQISVEIEAAAEYYLDETLPAKLAAPDVMLLGGQYLLFELSYVNFPPNVFELIDEIKQYGYKPLLAHPERYPYLFDSIENFRKFKTAGCFLQLNILSLTGYYGKQTQQIAEALVDQQLVDFIGSDLHHFRHAEALRGALHAPYVQRLLESRTLLNRLL